LKRNLVRQQEIRANRASKFESIQKFVVGQNEYLSEHSRASAEIALQRVTQKITKFKTEKWVRADVQDGRIIVRKDDEALAELEKLDGCYVIKSNVPKEKADAQTLHDRYTDLEKIERDFRTLKQTHLALRPIYVRKESRTRGHVFSVMLALRLQRYMEAAWKDLDITVKEGLDHLSALSVVSVEVNGVTLDRLPEPDALSQTLLQKLNVTIPAFLPHSEARVYSKTKLKK